ncbi:hypothetical protein KDI_15460 [Dictyobacter arantiisoli]|uniref:Uncharacterized protein n=1 Tax=Dictyobacter arantiisoli TaxID=2014874 RepID=A0A5A5T999_9CHLR|nr:hypothetical protein KDI_15460 [Dictyobacter arantiisoli]
MWQVLSFLDFSVKARMPQTGTVERLQTCERNRDPRGYARTEAQRHREPVLREPILPFHFSLRIT